MVVVLLAVQLGGLGVGGLVAEAGLGGVVVAGQLVRGLCLLARPLPTLQPGVAVAVGVAGVGVVAVGAVTHAGAGQEVVLSKYYLLLLVFRGGAAYLYLISILI